MPGERGCRVVKRTLSLSLSRGGGSQKVVLPVCQLRWLRGRRKGRVEKLMTRASGKRRDTGTWQSFCRLHTASRS